MATSPEPEQPWYSKLLCGFGKVEREEVREVHINHPEYATVHAHYDNNVTQTTKYNLVTFLPKALFEQYRRVANIYFTIVAVLSLTPYSPVRAWTTFLPLGIVLGVSIIKEAVEDFKRYRQDREVNSRIVEVYDCGSGKFGDKQWKDVCVGDVVVTRKDGFFPADLLLLSSENPEGLAYIETMNLDGETNLKIKQAVDATKEHGREQLQGLKGTVHCEPPNSQLYRFTGYLEVDTEGDGGRTKVPLGPSAMLLRGCSLRNTGYILGLVVYAGHDTKIFMNATQPPSKRSQIEKTIDKIIYVMFALLFFMCLIGAIYFGWWSHNRGSKSWYLRPDDTAAQYDGKSPGIVGVTSFITSFILYGYLIPISLYVSMEMVKVLQIVWISRDRSMYHAETDTPALARTSNLNEELGMVNTVLSDKTGTLTRNVMEFFKCSIAGMEYGCGVTEVERSNSIRKGVPVPEPQQHTLEQAARYREDYFNFYDQRLMDGAWAKTQQPEIAEQFFRLLAVCHTVIPEGPAEPDKIKYAAESPDEAALVTAAKAFGFFFYRRDNTSITVRESLPGGQRDVRYEVLNILEFNSTRKRMSVIVRDEEDDRIMLYCKGADTVIYERLDPGYAPNVDMKKKTTKHMEEYGTAGLRTLCLSYTELDPDFYEAWEQEYADACTSLDNRDALKEAAGEKVETRLRLLGCTAIEDKLQEGVPECISTLKLAGIRVWVLTGDKMETAINIGYACSLLADEMKQHRIDATLDEAELQATAGDAHAANVKASERVADQLKAALKWMEDAGADGSFVTSALIIDGAALSYALHERLSQLFLDVALQCAAVVCCRVSPLQKARVTEKVKNVGDVTLAIGDGANDVGMIQRAHIGVGISGQEGMQAVMAADFAIAQFRYLVPLLLVHGRLSYKRIARMVNFFFYKNLLFGLTIFAYNAYTPFSGQPIYQDFYMTLFNVVFTSTPPLIVGWFDMDLDKEYGLRFPALYQETQKNLYFNFRAISGWLFNALVQFAILLTMMLRGVPSTAVGHPNGNAFGLWETGIIMFTIVIITVNVQIGLVLEQWSPLHHTFIWASIIVWFLYIVIYGFFPIDFATDLYHLFTGVVALDAFYWLYTLIAGPIACLLPFVAFRTIKRYFWPAMYQRVEEFAYLERKGRAPVHSDLESTGPAAQESIRKRELERYSADRARHVRALSRQTSVIPEDEAVSPKRKQVYLDADGGMPGTGTRDHHPSPVVSMLSESMMRAGPRHRRTGSNGSSSSLNFSRSELLVDAPSGLSRYSSGGGVMDLVAASSTANNQLPTASRPASGTAVPQVAMQLASFTKRDEK